MVDHPRERQTDILQACRRFRPPSSSHSRTANWRFCVTNNLGKLGVRDRTQAALRARELGLL